MTEDTPAHELRAEIERLKKELADALELLQGLESVIYLEVADRRLDKDWHDV